MAKSKPIGVRFNLEKLELIQKEQNLTSAQQVVNYLMDNYGKIKPIEKVFGTKPTTYEHFTPEPVIMLLNDNPEPPKDLTGIDLSIWKANNWNKNPR